VERLRGMFAFALWDARRQRLLLARDRIGIKPLYVAHAADRVVFGSELKAVMADPDIEPELDITAFDDYLAFGFVPGPKSIFRTVRKLQPGHVLTVDRQGFAARERRYWALSWSDPASDGSLQEWIPQVREKIDEAVAAHLLADVPVGAFLSGGIDSGLVVATASRRVADFRTFSIGFPAPYSSELPGARAVARRFNTTHAEEIANPEAGLDPQRLVRHFDEPFADSSAVPTLLVSTLARQSVKVALSGDGGDEAFGGYARYVGELREDAFRRRLPFAARLALRPVATAWPRALRGKSFLSNLTRRPGRAYAHSVSITGIAERHAITQPWVRTALCEYDPYARFEAIHQNARAADPLRGLLAVDTGILLPDNYLVKVDRASMAVGLEVRPPILDHEVLELAARMPSVHKVDRGKTKIVLRHAYGDVLPPDTVSGPKRGFEMPVDGWFRRELRGRFEADVLKADGPIRQLLDLPAVERMFTQHRRGLIRRGNLLWAIYVLTHWANNHVFHV
jgi:asparagine synthase (glutamine-hydrolysing)